MSKSTYFPKVVRGADLPALYGITKATAYKLMKRNLFPQPIRWGTANTGWLTEDLDRWIDERKAARDEGKT